MASWPTIKRKGVGPVGGWIAEHVELVTDAATSVTADLDFTSALRYVVAAEWCKLCTPSLMTNSFITFTTQPTAFPAHALVTIADMDTATTDTANEKRVSLTLFGRR